MRMRIAVAAAFVMVLVLAAPMCASADDYQVDFQVSPQTLYLNAEVTWVTIHVPVAYNSIFDYCVSFDGVDVPVAWDKADLQGNLVIKLSTDDVAAAVQPGVVELAVDGMLWSGDTFGGAMDYTIRDGANQKSR